MKPKTAKLLSSLLPFSSWRKAFRLKYTTKYERHRAAYHIGEYSYMGEDVAIPNGDETTIGKYCSIGRGVYLGTSQHPTHMLTTHPFAYNESGVALYGPLKTPKANVVDIRATRNRPVKVGNDVWIGANAIVMDGVTLGDGAVIGAGAVVTKDVPPYAIVAGVPAKVLRFRFDPATIERLLKVKWLDYPAEVVVNLPFADVQACLTHLEQNQHLAPPTPADHDRRPQT